MLVEASDVVLAATTAPYPHLVDAMINEIARAHGRRETVTFDQRFARSRGSDPAGLRISL